MPTVSVLMPSYNHAEFLPAAIDSLIAQSLGDWELIAVDDVSTDGSFAALNGIGDPRCRAYLNDENLGTYGTLAKALALATGEFVAVLDSDDVWHPAKLERQVGLMTELRDIQFCYTKGETIGNVGDSNDVHGDWPTSEIQEPLPYLLEQNRILASSVLFRKKAAGFNPTLRYSGDWEALLRPARTAAVGFISEPLTFWRIHDRNSFVRSPGQVSEEIRMRRSILDVPGFWKSRDLSAAEIDTGLSRCALHLSALYVLQGRNREARSAARLALRFHRSLQTLKRLATVSLSPNVALRRLWPNSSMLQPSPDAPSISFV
jgi:glycosyltransferase involved in cell wall biosynthesis